MSQPEIERTLTKLRLLPDKVFELAESLGGKVAGMAAEGPLDVAALAGLRPSIFAAERLDLGLAGMGFVAAPGVLADADRYLEWWQYRPGGEPEQLIKDLDPGSAGFYDYPAWDWYKNPESGVARSINGPYVDESCTGEYALTLTVPVRLDGRFLGVAGADVLVAACQTVAEPMLRAIGRPAFVTTAAGRILVSGSAHRISGEVYRGGPGFTAHPSAHGFILYVKDP